MFKRLTLIICVTFIFVSQAQAFWIWTPKDKKFVNPKWTAKDSPKQQLAYAQEIFEQGDYKGAIKECNALLRHYPKAFEAAEAQLYIGKSLEKLGKLYDAYLAYQKIIDKYPFSDKMNMVLERQFEIAQQFSERETKILGIRFPQQYYAIEIYRKIIENYPYGELAPLSQYKIGLMFKSLGSYVEAKNEFEKLIDTYPESEWAQAAQYQLAESASLGSLNAEYDQALSKEAKKEFEEFIEKHPDAELVQETRQQVELLTDKAAQKDFLVAEFYEKQRAFSSAEIYYNDIIRSYPKSEWAQKSQERLKKMREEKKL